MGSKKKPPEDAHSVVLYNAEEESESATFDWDALTRDLFKIAQKHLPSAFDYAKHKNAKLHNTIRWGIVASVLVSGAVIGLIFYALKAEKLEFATNALIAFVSFVGGIGINMAFKRKSD